MNRVINVDLDTKDGNNFTCMRMFTGMCHYFAAHGILHLGHIQLNAPVNTRGQELGPLSYNIWVARK